MTPEKITALAALQREILSVVQHYVKPGGVLIYSTCTVSKAENEENMQWFEEHFPFGLRAWMHMYLKRSAMNIRKQVGFRSFRDSISRMAFLLQDSGAVGMKEQSDE